MTNDNTGIRFCLYVRKSSDRVDRQILSIESQINELKALAKERSLQIVKIYEDSASAHKRNNRPAFNEITPSLFINDDRGIGQVCGRRHIVFPSSNSGLRAYTRQNG